MIKGEVRDAYSTIKAPKKFSGGGGGLKSNIVSVPVPL